MTSKSHSLSQKPTKEKTPKKESANLGKAPTPRELGYCGEPKKERIKSPRKVTTDKVKDWIIRGANRGENKSRPKSKLIEGKKPPKANGHQEAGVP